MPASWAGVVRPVVVDGSCQPSLANKILKGPAKFLGSLAVSSFRRSDNDQARLFDWHWEFHNPSASMTSRPGIRKKCPGRARRYERPPSGSDQALDKRVHRSRRRIVQTILLQEHCLFTFQPARAGDCKMPERFALRKTCCPGPTAIASPVTLARRLPRNLHARVFRPPDQATARSESRPSRARTIAIAIENAESPSRLVSVSRLQAA
jgi:hypothetical protein